MRYEKHGGPLAARPFDRESPNPAMDYVKSLKILSGVEVYNPKVRAGANEMALEVAHALKLPQMAGSDARDSLDELGYAATLFKKPVATQAELVKAISNGEMWPVQMGELPRLQRPGEAKTAEAKSKKKNRRRWRH